MNDTPSPVKILVVDDEPHIVYILQTKLRSAGFEVEIARNGAEALQAARDCPPALVVTDYNMPQMDGLELSIRLKQQEATAQTPIIMLTGRGHDVTDEQRRQTNICCLESKPFSARHLLQLIEKTLSDGHRSAA